MSICLIQEKKHVPIRSDVFKHGDKVYLALTNSEQGVHIALTGDALDLFNQLTQITNLLRRAIETTDQGHISRAEARAELAAPTRFNRIKIEDLAEATPDQAKGLIYLRFKDVPAFQGIDGYYFQEWEKYAEALTRQGEAEDEAQPVSQLERDLAAIGKAQPASKSEVARLLGIKPGGGYNWGRICKVWDAMTKKEKAAA